MIFRISTDFSLIVGVALLLSLWAVENQAGVVLKNFKPRRIIMAELEAEETTRLGTNKNSKNVQNLNPALSVITNEIQNLEESHSSKNSMPVIPVKSKKAKQNIKKKGTEKQKKITSDQTLTNNESDSKLEMSIWNDRIGKISETSKVRKFEVVNTESGSDSPITHNKPFNTESTVEFSEEAATKSISIADTTDEILRPLELKGKLKIDSTENTIKDSDGEKFLITESTVEFTESVNEVSPAILLKENIDKSEFNIKTEITRKNDSEESVNSIIHEDKLEILKTDNINPDNEQEINVSDVTKKIDKIVVSEQDFIFSKSTQPIEIHKTSDPLSSRKNNLTSSAKFNDSISETMTVKINSENDINSTLNIINSSSIENPKKNFALKEISDRPIDENSIENLLENESEEQLSNEFSTDEQKSFVLKELKDPIREEMKEPISEGLKDPISEALKDLKIDEIIKPSADEMKESKIDELKKVPETDDVDKILTKISNVNNTSEKFHLNNIENQSNESGINLESVVSSGIDFIINSEVAKNAAQAMDIFNISDSSLTDHVIEDSDLHGLIDIILPHSSTADESENNVLLNKTKVSKSSSDANNESSIKSHISEHLNESDIQFIETSVKPVASLQPNETNTGSMRKCPPSGICILWFVSRDSCSDSDQCPGDKLCCKVRCSKRCIDV